MSIQTKEDWWQEVEDHWSDLLDIFARFLPMYLPAPRSLRTVVSETNPAVAETAWDDVERCRKEKDHEKLREYLYAAWESAPDNPAIHTFPSWGVLCDLLSESWVFEPEP